MVEAIEKLATRTTPTSTMVPLISAFPIFRQYGKLSHNDFAGIRSGARVDVDEYDKADARDFVLWKGRKEKEPFWTTPFGDGRPAGILNALPWLWNIWARHSTFMRAVWI